MTIKTEVFPIGGQYRLPGDFSTDEVMYQKPMAADKKLLAELSARQADRKVFLAAGLKFHNCVLASLVESSYDGTGQIEAIEDMLRTNGGLRFNITEEPVEITYGEYVNLRLIGATDSQTKNEMAQAFWIRDQTQTGLSFIQQYTVDPNRYQEQRVLGHDLILSSLTLISTQWQLARFQAIIDNCQNEKFVNDPKNWPHIFLHFNNLSGKKIENWSHKQDAWQMTVWGVFEALNQGLIKPEELIDQHRQLLQMVVPFLKSVNFINRENSGSWEELEANKTSTLAWETAVLRKIIDYSDKKDFEFLETKDFKKIAEKMFNQGLDELARRIPDESPDYAKDSPQYRGADASLLYLLDLGIPQMLAERQFPEDLESRQAYEWQLESEILDQVRKLIDPRTNGIRRYGAGGMRDSYQGPNFALGTTSKKLSEMCGAPTPTGDFSGERNFIDRDQIVAEGKAAAWTHFNPQISAWASRRYLETGNDRYLDLATDFLNRTLVMITGEDEYFIRSKDGGFEVMQVPAFRISECDVTYQYETDEGMVEMVTTSPHTPLNWAVAKTAEAITLLKAALTGKTQNNPRYLVKLR